MAIGLSAGERAFAETPHASVREAGASQRIPARWGIAGYVFLPAGRPRETLASGTLRQGDEARVAYPVAAGSTKPGLRLKPVDCDRKLLR